jgi:3-dehydroquinate dehydratase I
MICVPLANLSYEHCLEAVKLLDFAEIRLDLLDLSPDQVGTLFAANPNLIATCRPGQSSEAERKALFLRAIASGAAYVDVEVETADAFKHEVLQAARAQDCQVIISYHDFEKTPEPAELEHIIQWCSEMQPEIIKIACMVHTDRDNARLLGLLDSPHRMLVVGMGERGKLTRVVAPLLGSVWTFAPSGAATATAPGQLVKEEVEALMAQWQALRP